MLKGRVSFIVHSFTHKRLVNHLLCARSCVFQGGNNNAEHQSPTGLSGSLVACVLDTCD